MKKVLIAILLILSLSLSVHASGRAVVDNAMLFDSVDLRDLTETAEAIAEEFQTDIVILTVSSLDGVGIEDYADDYFDENRLGRSDSRSGVLFVIAIEERQWHILENGEANQKIRDFDMSDIEYAMSRGDFYEACTMFLDCIRAELSREPGETGWGTLFLIALLVGAATGGITVFVMRRKMNTIRPQRGASSYMTDGTYDLFRCHDIFLYSNVTKVRIQENNSSGGGGGGGRSGRSGSF